MENQTNYQYLKKEWEAVATTYNHKPELIKSLFETIYIHYSESHRAYHNPQHLVELLELIAGHTDSVNKNIHVLAAFFHDIIYVPGRQDNEWESAQLATRMMQELGVSSVEIEAVCQIIMATQAHEWFDDSIPN